MIPFKTISMRLSKGKPVGNLKVVFQGGLSGKCDADSTDQIQFAYPIYRASYRHTGAPTGFKIIQQTNLISVFNEAKSTFNNQRRSSVFIKNDWKQ